MLAAIVGVAMFCVAAPAKASVSLTGAVPERYDYELEWRPDQRLLFGDGAVLITNAGPLPIDHFWLRQRANGDDALARLRWVSSARFDPNEATAAAVRLELTKTLKPGASRYISFGFRLRVPRANTSLGRSAGVDLFGDALPVVAAEGPRGIRIGPEPDYGEGSMQPVAQWLVSVDVPRGLSARLPGRVDRVTLPRGNSRYWTDVDVRDFAFAIGRLKTATQLVRGFEVSVSGTTATRSQLRAVLRRTANAFRTMQRWYGQYKLPTLQVILGDLPFGGSEYPGIVFSTPDNATIAHEVAHQWFYGIVGSDQYADPFLDESLTAFTEQRFHKSYRCNLAAPLDGRKPGLGTGMSYWGKHPEAYERTIYRGGACALTLLQRDLGADVFDRALRAYVAANADKIAGVDDFLAAIRNVAPGYDLARWEKLVGLS